MKIIVFGATGSIGRHAVEQLLEEGHEVTAFARKPEALAISHPRLHLYAGDILNAETVGEAIRGHEGVLVAIGSGNKLNTVVRSEGTKNVIEGMKKHNVQRLVCQSTLGVGDSWENLNFFWKRIMFGLLLRSVLREHEVQEKLVRESGLEWTIVRPSAFVDGPVTRQYKEAIKPNDHNLTMKITRADVADFLKRQFADSRYLHHAVGISN